MPEYFSPNKEFQMSLTLREPVIPCLYLHMAKQYLQNRLKAGKAVNLTQLSPAKWLQRLFVAQL